MCGSWKNEGYVDLYDASGKLHSIKLTKQDLALVAAGLLVAKAVMASKAIQAGIVALLGRHGVTTINALHLAMAGIPVDAPHAIKTLEEKIDSGEADDLAQKSMHRIAELGFEFAKTEASAESRAKMSILDGTFDEAREQAGNPGWDDGLSVVDMVSEGSPVNSDDASPIGA